MAVLLIASLSLFLPFLFSIFIYSFYIPGTSSVTYFLNLPLKFLF